MLEPKNPTAPVEGGEGAKLEQQNQQTSALNQADQTSEEGATSTEADLDK